MQNVNNAEVRGWGINETVFYLTTNPLSKNTQGVKICAVWVAFRNIKFVLLNILLL